MKSDPYSSNRIRRSVVAASLTMLMLQTASIVSANQLPPLDEFPVWKISAELPTAYHQYYDVPAWNADGSRLILIPRQNLKRIFLASTLGGPLEEIQLQSPGRRRADDYVQWDARNPQQMYFMTEHEGQRLLVAQSLDGKRSRLLTVGPDYRLGVPHPDGEHLLIHPRIRSTADILIYSLKKRAVVHTIPVPGPVHRVRFTKDPDLSVFMNLSGQSNRFIIGVDGIPNPFYPDQAGHPDWAPSGRLFSFFKSGERRGLYVRDIQKEINYLVEGTKGVFGHQSWAYDGSFIVLDVNNDEQPFKDYIMVADMADLTARPIVRHDSIYLDGSGSQSTHPHVIASPDGTKAVYNVNRNPEKPEPHVYVVRLRKPSPVVNPQASLKGREVSLNWTLPPAKERAGTLILAVSKAGEASELAFVKGNSWKGRWPEGIAQLKLLTREHSGLLSEPAIISKNPQTQ